MARMTNLGIPFTLQFNITTSGTPEALSVKIRAATIAFVEGTPNADTITDSGNGFLLAGFQAGDEIVVSGSSSNNGTYHIASVTAGTITLQSRDDLTNESAGATVKITADKKIPDGISLLVKAKYGNTGTIQVADSSAKATSGSAGGFTLRNNEAVILQLDKLSDLYLDASVSLEGVECIFEKNIQA